MSDYDEIIKRELDWGKPVKILNLQKPQKTVMRGVVFNKGLDLRDVRDFITPVGKFYQRSHLSSAPTMAKAHEDCPDVWPLTIGDQLTSLGELKKYGHFRRVMHMECTGNSHATNTASKNVRSLARHITWKKLFRLLDPAHWKPLLTFMRGGRKSDLISNGEFAGVYLWDVLQNNFIIPVWAKQIVFIGADRGYDGLHHRVTQDQHHYARAFDVEKLRQYEPMLCWEMNGKPLAIQHGFPLRLVVPGVYGAEYVKWLTEIRFVSTRWEGHFQKEYYNNKTVDGDWVPCHEKGPKSLVLHVRRNGLTIRVVGVAWGGIAPLSHVSVKVEQEGYTSAYHSARWITPIDLDESWIWWSVDFVDICERGTLLKISPKAFGADGSWQPDEQPPELFYGNNSVITAEVKL